MTKNEFIRFTNQAERNNSLPLAEYLARLSHKSDWGFTGSLQELPHPLSDEPVLYMVISDHAKGRRNNHRSSVKVDLSTLA